MEKIVSPPKTKRAQVGPVAQMPIHYLPKDLIVLLQPEDRILRQQLRCLN